MVEAKLRRAGRGKRLVIESGAKPEIDKNLALIREAFSHGTLLLFGPDESVEAMIERPGIARGRLSSLVRLSYLAPDIVLAILAGRKPVELTPTRLLKLRPAPRPERAAVLTESEVRCSTVELSPNGAAPT